MAIADRLRVSRILLMAVAAAYLISPQSVIAQGTRSLSSLIEQLRRIPPDPKLVEKSNVDFGLRMLNWQVRRGEMTQRHLDEGIVRIRNEIRAIERGVGDIVSAKTPAQFRFATDAVREQLIGQVLQKLLNAELEIAAHLALINEIQNNLQSPSPNEAERKRSAMRSELLSAREKMLQKQLDLLQDQLNLRETQRKQGGPATFDEVFESRIRIEGLKGELAELLVEKELNKQETSPELAERLANLRLESHRLKAQRDAAQLQLEELAKAAEVARELRSRQREIDQLSERLQLRVRRLEEVTMETEELRLLLKQVEEAMPKDAQPAESGEGETTPKQDP